MLSSALASAGYRCDVALNGQSALTELERQPFDAVISDWYMDGMSGLELVETVAQRRPKLPVIIMSGQASGSSPDALARGAVHFMQKPLDLEQLRGLIQHAIADRAQAADTAIEDTILPISAVTRKLVERIQRLANSSAPVLIRGESGTGKELVARAIHDRGSRAQAPFVAVNTAAVPEHLLESELFGHVRGAFSGASNTRRGLLTEANHGTVLLDEIGDMPIGLQAKLLRVIQFGEVRPLGSDRAHRVDVRFLAATHRDLPARIEAGSFREDLYFRLNVLGLTVPTLRERRSEIPALVAHFLARARARHPDSPARFIAPDALRMMSDAPWPGNVRQLASMVERLVVFAESAVVTCNEVSEIEPSNALEASEELPSLEQAQRGFWSLEQLNQHYVDWVMNQVSRDKVNAAAILGVNVSTLYRWLRSRSVQ